MHLAWEDLLETIRFENPRTGIGLFGLCGGAVRDDSKFARRLGDLTRKIDIQLTQCTNVVGGESYRDERIPKINVRMMISRVGE